MILDILMFKINWVLFILILYLYIFVDLKFIFFLYFKDIFRCFIVLVKKLGNVV